MMLLMVTSVFGSDLERNIPASVEPGELEVTLTLSGLKAGKLVVLEEALPKPLTIKKWEITGVKESKSDIKTRVKDNAWGWEFTPTESTVKVTYTLQVPESASGEATLVASWFDPEGFKKKSDTVKLGAVVVAETVPPPVEVEPQEPPAPKVVPQTPPPEKSTNYLPLILLFIVAFVIGVLFYQKKNKIQQERKFLSRKHHKSHKRKHK